MKGAGIAWKFLKTASSHIPWGTIVENTPALLDLVERTRDRFRAGGGPDSYGEELRVLHEENMRLADSLLQTAAQLQEVRASLEVVVARQKMIGSVAVVSLLVAIASLALWVVR